MRRQIPAKCLGTSYHIVKREAPRWSLEPACGAGMYRAATGAGVAGSLALLDWQRPPPTALHGQLVKRRACPFCGDFEELDLAPPVAVRRVGTAVWTSGWKSAVAQRVRMEPERGRQAERPQDIPKPGWGDIFWRTKAEFSDDHTGPGQSALGAMPQDFRLW